MTSDNSWKKIISWSLYDFANSAFATTVMAGFFPLFFKQYWSAGVDATRSTFHLGIANSIASGIVVVMAPILGAIADRGSFRKKFLISFAALGVAATGLLYLVGQGHWLFAAALFVIAAVGFSGSNVFYDSLIISVAAENKVDFVSALGYSLGYLGGGLLFALNVFMVLKPQLFGLADAGQAVRISFITVAIWWSLFSIPLMLFVKEPLHGEPMGWKKSITGGFGQLADTFRKVRKLKVVILFLVGYWFYIDGVHTIIRMAVDYGLSIGLDSNSLILALLITQFVGFPSAIVFGKIGEKLGPKTGIYIAIIVYVCITGWGYFLDTEAEFFAMAIAIGLVQGGVQSLSRSFYTRIIPKDQAAEFFGFYNMLGKFAAVLGPILMGWVAVATGAPRNAIFVVTVLLIIGAACLFFVNEEEGKRAAAELVIE
ncbi:MAG: MFS transporter [bacterium]